jgi:thioesterase domain-containing protein
LAETLGYRAERSSPDATARPSGSDTRPASPGPPEVVNIQPRGSKRPLFFVHPGAGDPSDYLYLSRHLGADQPFYGLPGFDLQRPYASIEEKAARSILSLRGRQPAGPYLLGGWSFGALVAFEAAQQLQRLGEEVALLALLDPMPPAPGDASGAPDLTDTRDPLTAARELAALSGWDAAELFDGLADLEPSMQLSALYEQARRTPLLPPGVTSEKFSDWLLMYYAKLRCAINYRPQVYAGNLSILQASETPFPRDRADLRDDAAHPFELWDRLCSGRVNVVPVPGSHQTMVLEPHAEVLAARLKSILETV